MTFQGAEEFLRLAAVEDVALLVVGDPFGATTHTDLCTRCKQMQVRPVTSRACSDAVQIPYEVVHNASIMNAIGCCGLQLYNFGRTVRRRGIMLAPTVATGEHRHLHGELEARQLL